MNTQLITTPAGDRLVVIPEEDFRVLAEAAEDAADSKTVRRFQDRLAAGEEEFIPSEYADRILNGENKVLVWREFRGLTTAELAARAGVGQPELAGIEADLSSGTIGAVRKIAAALRLDIDDLV